MQHPLPQDETLAAEAIRSVHRRGFYDSAPLAAHNEHLMAQFLRLVEEVGEYQQARTYNAAKPDKAKEVADIAIVAYQIAWLTGAPLDMLHGGIQLASTTFAAEVGTLARALRTWTGRTADARPITTALQRIVALCHIVAEQMGMRLPDLVAEKLAADEQRGYQHAGVVG